MKKIKWIKSLALLTACSLVGSSVWLSSLTRKNETQLKALSAINATWTIDKKLVKETNNKIYLNTKNIMYQLLLNEIASFDEKKLTLTFTNKKTSKSYTFAYNEKNAEKSFFDYKIKNGEATFDDHEKEVPFVFVKKSSSDEQNMYFDIQVKTTRDDKNNPIEGEWNGEFLLKYESNSCGTAQEFKFVNELKPIESADKTTMWIAAGLAIGTTVFVPSAIIFTKKARQSKKQN